MDPRQTNTSINPLANQSNLVAQAFRMAIYIQPIHFFLSITTNILNICVLGSRALRSSPCAHYFLAYAVFSIIYTCLLCPSQILRNFSIVWINDMFNCKISTYILYLIPYQANLMLNFASIDRYYSSLRLRTHHPVRALRTARIAIVLGTLSCALFMLPTIFIYNWDPITHVCLLKSDLLVRIYTLSQVSLYYVLLPLLLIVFGFLTISNIRQQTARLEPHMPMRRARRTDRQLHCMLLLQVFVHLFFMLPFGVTYTINSFEPSTQTLTVLGIRLIFVMWQQCDYFASFFLYVFSGSIYRHQFFQLLRSIKRRLSSTQINTEQA